MNGKQPLTVAVFGTDSWLRASVAGGLRIAGHHAQDIGPGAASMRGVDAIVCTPALLPRSLSAAKDVGTASASVTFAAAAAANVKRTIVVTRTAAPKEGASPFHDELRMLERKAVGMVGNVTAVRVTHPFGGPGDAGPVVGALRRYQDYLVGAGQGVRVQPVFVEDLVAVIEAAVAGRLSAGAVEMGGPDVMDLCELAALAGVTGVGTGRDRHRRRSKVLQFLAHDSVAPRSRLPLDVDLHSVHSVWSPSASPLAQL